METLRRRWDDYRPSKTQVFWTGAGCIAATLVAGFGFAGWVTGGGAAKMVAEASTNARQELATAVCVEQFLAAGNTAPRLAKLQAASWYDRSEFVAAGGWATMPDRKEPNSAVASLCAGKLAELELKSAVTPASAAVN